MLMKSNVAIILILAMVLIVSCNKSTEPDPDTTLRYSTLPVSDTVQTVFLRIAVKVSDGSVLLTWSPPQNYVSFELDRSEDTTMVLWQLIYSGTAFQHNIGQPPLSKPVLFRVRVVYAQVVSQWSNIVRFN